MTANAARSKKKSPESPPGPFVVSRAEAYFPAAASASINSGTAVL